MTYKAETFKLSQSNQMGKFMIFISEMTQTLMAIKIGLIFQSQILVANRYL